MKYVIMCGGVYKNMQTPKQLLQVGGEKIVERTIRLLKQKGITDIYISSNNKQFSYYAPLLQHNNDYCTTDYDQCTGHWCSGFYPFDEPACYLFGDVVFSPTAIDIIIQTKTNDIEFFASAPPFAKNYPKPYAEPFALKVVNQEHLREAVKRCIQLENEGKWDRKPIMWELWQVIKGTPINKIDYTNYTIINDYTCDIDNLKDVKIMNELVK